MSQTSRILTMDYEPFNVDGLSKTWRTWALSR